MKYKEKNNETNFDIFKVDASEEERLTPFSCIVNYIIKNPELECYIFADGCPDSALKIWDKDNSVEVIWSQTIKQPPSNFSFLDDLLPFREEPVKNSAVIKISFPTSPAKLFSIYYPEFEASPSGLLVIAKEEIPKDILEAYKSIFYPNITDESALNFVSKAFEKWAIFGYSREIDQMGIEYRFENVFLSRDSNLDKSFITWGKL